MFELAINRPNIFGAILIFSSSILHCTAQYCTVPNCTALHCTSLPLTRATLVVWVNVILKFLNVAVTQSCKWANCCQLCAHFWCKCKLDLFFCKFMAYLFLFHAKCFVCLFLRKNEFFFIFYSRKKFELLMSGFFFFSSFLALIQILWRYIYG